MACFIVPATEAIVTTVASKALENHEKNHPEEVKGSTPMSEKVGWLSKLLWGGSVLLAFEHLWHGEIVPFPPFLTAFNNPEEVPGMLHEMATTGVLMAVLVTLVWIGMVLVTSRWEAMQKEKKYDTGA